MATQLRVLRGLSILNQVGPIALTALIVVACGSDQGTAHHPNEKTLFTAETRADTGPTKAATSTEPPAPTATSTATVIPTPVPLSSAQYPACGLVPDFVATKARQSLTASAEVPETISSFLGTWEGRWGPAAADASMLLVQEVTGSSAQALYLYDGQVLPMKMTAAPGVLQRTGNPSFTWTLSPGSEVLNGVRNNVGAIAKVAMTRCNPGASPSADRPSLAPVDGIPRCKYIPPFVGAESLLTNVPAASVPASLAALAGTWEGRWNDATSWETVLAIRSLTATQATAIYTFQGAVESKVYQVLGSALRFRGNGFSFEYTLSSDGNTLLGAYDATGYKLRVTMTRCVP